jgi:hypothetical protein
VNTACPECGDTLHAKSVRCACGWTKPEATKGGPNHHRCAHIGVGGKRCPDAGTMTAATSGDSSTWYCSRHFWQRGRLSGRSLNRETGLEAIAMVREIFNQPKKSA